MFDEYSVVKRVRTRVPAQSSRNSTRENKMDKIGRVLLSYCTTHSVVVTVVVVVDVVVVVVVEQ